jgi:hypothetical protein
MPIPTAITTIPRSYPDIAVNLYKYFLERDFLYIFRE